LAELKSFANIVDEDAGWRSEFFSGFHLRQAGRAEKKLRRPVILPLLTALAGHPAGAVASSQLQTTPYREVYSISGYSIGLEMPPRIPLPFSRIARPKSSPCIFCQSQQFPPLQRAKHTKPSKETVVTHKNPIRIDPIQREKVVRGRVSFDRDRELRRNVYEGARERKHINLEPDEAEALITQFTHGVPIEQIITSR